jgi:branched-chain amino acid transport system ATP-binding protein
MNPTECDGMVNLLKKLREERKIAILLVEHDMRTVMTLSDKITVLDFGKKIAEGLPKEIRENPKVVAAYIGSSEVLF